MQNRARFGWLLVGAFCVSLSCGGGNGSGVVPGYGVACESDKECTGYDLLCDTAEDKCVQCFSEDDCKPAENCVSGLCQSPTSCQDSRDCVTDQVCNEDVGICVQCMANRDCESGEKCVAQSCVDAQSCEFTSDCEDGQLCDVDAGMCVTCRDDDDCPASRVCMAGECVTPDTGEGGESGTGGSTAGTTTGGTPNGGTPNGGRSGGGGMSGAGTGGMSGSAGTGGTRPACDCSTLGDVCTADERCVAPEMIEDFIPCQDDGILEIEGRSGPWAGDAAAGINFMRGFGDPGTGWADRTCAAWATCGLLAAGATDFAFIGFMLNDGSAYSLVGYTGLRIVLESANSIQVVVKTTGGGYFQYTLTSILGSNLRSAPFASMSPMNNSLELSLNLATVYEIQFSPTTPTACGYAIHRVELY